MDLIILIIAVISNITLGLFILLRNYKSATNILFFLLAIDVAAWSSANFIATHITDPVSVLFWVRFVMFLAVPQAVLFFLLIHTFPRSKIVLNKFIFLVTIVFSIATMIITLSPYLFTTVEIKNGSLTPIPGLGMALFVPISVGSVIAGLYTLIKKIKKAQGIDKVQLKYILFGVLTMFLLILTFNFILLLLFKISFFVVLGPLYTFPFIASIAYAIVRHKLLDIRFVVARTIAYSFIVFTIGILYVGLAFTLSSLFLESTVPQNQLFMYTALTILIALSFEKLRQLIEKITDRIFFKGQYDSNQLLSTLAHIMSVNIELHILTTQILQTLISEMRVSKGAFILQGDDNKYTTIPLGFPDQFDMSHDQLIPLLSTHGIIIFDELEEGQLKQEMRNLGISIAKVLHVKEGIVGYLILGEKSSGEIYSEQDLKVLDILAPEVAVAIQNAVSYEKIKKFNVILSDEVKRATQDLQQANLRLKQLDQLKDDFVSIASHELRTPMTAIRSYVWMALNRPDIPLSEKMKKYLSRTLISTERLINLVNDMLNVSRIEAGRIEIKPQVFEIATLVNDVVAEVEPKANEKMIKLQVMNAAMPKVFADSDKVHQVLLNLIGNALKFTPNDGVIAVNFFTDGQVVEVKVQDSGVGISREDLSKLFKKFERLDNSYVATATSGGTGLGLYIAKSLIELMHGKIWASSEGLGKGTTFVFALPIATQEVINQADKFTIKPQGEIKTLEPVTL